MNAALGVRFLAGALAALFLAGTALAVAIFFAGAAFLAGVVFAVAILRFLCAEVVSQPMTPICSGSSDATGENPSFQAKDSFFRARQDLPVACYLLSLIQLLAMLSFKGSTINWTDAL